MASKMREAYGQTLLELSQENQRIVVLDADLSKATMTCMFAEAHPHRFFDMGVQEANMIGVAAGFALDGFIPFVTTFAVFMPGRNYEQIRNTICYSGLNVKLVATHAGVGVGFDGGSHQSIEDLALARVLPGLEVYSPADKNQTAAIIRHISTTNLPAYVRIPRQGGPEIYPSVIEHYSQEPDVVLDGGAITIVATGVGLGIALEAANSLRSEGIECRVVNVHCLKPLDEREIVRAARETAAIVTVEDHSVIGGLGSAVCECVSGRQACRVARIGVQDQFGQSGSMEQVLRHYGLHQDNVVACVKRLLG